MDLFIVFVLLILIFALVAMQGEIDNLKDNRSYISELYREIIADMNDLYVFLCQTRKELEKMKREKKEND